MHSASEPRMQPAEKGAGMPQGGLKADRLSAVDLDALEKDARQVAGPPGPCPSCDGSCRVLIHLMGGWTKEERCSACGGSGRHRVDEAALAHARRVLSLVAALRDRDAELDGSRAQHAALAGAARAYVEGVTEHASAYDLLSARRERLALDALMGGAPLGYIPADKARRYVEALVAHQEALDACQGVPRGSHRFVTTDEARLTTLDAVTEARREFEAAVKRAEGR